MLQPARKWAVLCYREFNNASQGKSFASLRTLWSMYQQSVQSILQMWETTLHNRFIHSVLLEMLCICV